MLRQSLLIADKSLTADNTEIIDLAGSDPISRIDIQYKGTNAGTTPTAHPAKFITDVEIVDGGQIIQKVDGIQAQGVGFYHTKQKPFNVLSFFDNNQCTATISLHFGRDLFDEEIALVPARFKNLQLKITTDLDAAGCSADAGNLKVIAHVFDQKNISPMGYFKLWEIYDYALVSSAYETIDLPIDHAIRMIMIQSLAAGKAPNAQINQLRLSEDNDKRVPLEEEVSDYLKWLGQSFPLITESFQGIAGTAEVNFFVTPTYEVNYSYGGYASTANYGVFENEYGGRVGVITNADGSNFQAMVIGSAPHGAYPIIPGNLQKIEDWYNVRNLRSLKLRLKGGSSVGSSSTAQVLAQQLVRY
jgi:hypothetical protein